MLWCPYGENQRLTANQDTHQRLCVEPLHLSPSVLIEQRRELVDRPEVHMARVVVELPVGHGQNHTPAKREQLIECGAWPFQMFEHFGAENEIKLDGSETS